MKLPPEEKLARELFRATAKAIAKKAKWKNASSECLVQWRALSKYIAKHFNRKVKR